jgi:opacity protein-like surface antigen
MKKIFMLVMFVFAVSITANAQDYPRFEGWGSYTIFRADIDVLDNETLQGYGLGAQGNLSENFGIVAEFTSTHGASGPVSILVPGAVVVIPELDTRINTFLFGPRFSYRGKAVTAFAHVLLGGANSKLDDEKGTSGFEDSNTEFAMAIGGGVDVNLGKHFAIRAIQFDYLPIHTDINERIGGGTSSWLHNTRLQFGFVFKY